MSPYGDSAAVPEVSDAYNRLEVHVRGTGESDGSFDALGPRTQQDLAEVLGWACRQPWTNGRLGLWGFSASAIVAYNAMHLELPCVEAAVLGAGTHELYRDLLYPGGIPNLAPGLVVIGAIGGSTLAAGGDRLQRAPETSGEVLGGMLDAGLSYLRHPTLDRWWEERGMRGSVNDFPILMVTGFFDVESRGPFQAFQELRDRGAHLYVVGGHDGVPAGTGGADAERLQWFDRYLRDQDNGVDRHPAVQLWMADGDREDLLHGAYVRATGSDWPIPGTQWTDWHLDPARSGTATSLNDGTLSPAPGRPARQSYPAIPSLPTSTDPHTIAAAGAFNDLGGLTDMALAEPLGLSYTTAPFREDVVSAGPASVELVASSTLPETDLLVVLSDVAPDGTAHPVATGRLRTSYPDIDRSRSLVDGDGTVVQPYGRFDRKQPAAIGQARRYQIELWPIGNRFRTGHRLRLHVLGASALGVPSLPGLTTIAVGGPTGSVLHLPVLPSAAAQPHSDSR
jgi:predicted acyl esterase